MACGVFSRLQAPLKCPAPHGQIATSLGLVVDFRASGMLGPCRCRKLPGGGHSQRREIVQLRSLDLLGRPGVHSRQLSRSLSSKVSGTDDNKRCFSKLMAIPTRMIKRERELLKANEGSF